jgi:SHS2 domain-containing protein
VDNEEAWVEMNMGEEARKDWQAGEADGGGEGKASVTPEWLEALDHTADAGLVVTAPTVEEVFARAAWGMFSLITDPDRVRVGPPVRVEVQSTDRAALLVRWLSELNYRHLTRHELYAWFRIIELSEERVVAEVGGESIDPLRHVVYTEIKAVTFHGLEIGPVAGGWRAKVIFDL